MYLKRNLQVGCSHLDILDSLDLHEIHQWDLLLVVLWCHQEVTMDPWDHPEAFQEDHLLLGQWDLHGEVVTKCDHHSLVQDKNIPDLISDHQDMDQWDLLLVVQEVQISDKIYLKNKILDNHAVK